MTHTKETEHANRAPEPEFTSIEICAGAGGQAVGLHQAGFGHLALVEIDRHAVETLELNINDHEVWTWERAHCDVLLADVKEFDPHKDLIKGADLLKGRDLDLLLKRRAVPAVLARGKAARQGRRARPLPRMLDLVAAVRPRAVMIENVRGIMDPKFANYRDLIMARLQGARTPETTASQSMSAGSDTPSVSGTSWRRATSGTAASASGDPGGVP